MFYNKNKAKLGKSLYSGLEKFILLSFKELTESNFHSFWFNIKIKENIVCVYLYYDLDAAGSEEILSWHIYLQNKLDKVLNGVDLNGFDIVVLIIEAYDLWNIEDTDLK